jgi:cell division septation protein DedD
VREGGRHVIGRGMRGEFEVSVGGIVVLGTASALACVIVFLLGIYVGKGIAEQRFENEQRIVRLPASTDATPKEDGSLSFYDRLGQTPSSAPAAVATATPEEAPIRVAPPTAKDEPEDEPEATPTRARSAPAAAPTAIRAPQASAPSGGESGSFQVQVAAMSDQGRAQQVVRDLAAKGYTASVSPAVVGGRTLYRVRVGRFPSEEAARKAMTELRGAGFPEARLAAE